MLSSARCGSAALRSLRFGISSARLPQPSPFIRPQTTGVSYLTPKSVTRSFASFPRSLQQYAAQQNATADGVHEFTQFQELADEGIIHPTVINTLTSNMNIHTMTDVQRMTLNSCLDGSDVIGQAKTGTGKTLAFLLPIIQRILRDPAFSNQRGLGSRGQVDIRALIVSPTRELAEQIANEARRVVQGTNIQVRTAVGGTQKNYHLREMQSKGCHLLIGTPGRINDILSDKRSGVQLDNIETFVLDEADRLLDIGFAPAIEEMQAYMPDRSVKPRQTLMFSATVPKSVVSLVRQTMRPDFKFVRTIDPDEAPTHDRVPQKVVFLQGLQNQMPTILEIVQDARRAHEENPAEVMPFKAIVFFGSTNEVAMAPEGV